MVNPDHGMPQTHDSTQPPAAAASMRSWPKLEPQDTLLSYLPLAHIYERALVEAAMAVGAAVGCWQVRGWCMGAFQLCCVYSSHVCCVCC